MILYIQTRGFIKGGMYLRIESAEKDGTSGEGNVNGYVADSADMLRIEYAGKRRDMMGKSEKGCAWECNAGNAM